MPTRLINLILFVFMFCLVACNTPSQQGNTEVETGTGAEEESTSPLTREEAQTLAEERADQHQASFAEANNTLNLTACDSIASLDLHYACTQNVIYSQAVSNSDKSKCKELENSETRKECQDEITAF